MAYGIIKVDTVTFTNDGIDKSVSISGLVQNPTFSGNVTVTGTLSGVTVTGTTASFTSGVFTSISGATVVLTSGVFASGTAAAPSVSVGTTSNGIYSPGTNQLALSTNGTGRLFVDASGRVGLNQSTFAANNPALHIRFSNAKIYLEDIDDVGNTSIDFAGASGIRSTIRGSSDASPFLAAEVNGGERLRITSAGLVGIGTSSPSSALHVRGSTSGTSVLVNSATSTHYTYFNAKNDSGVDVQLAANGTDAARLLTNSNHPLDFFTNGTRALRVDTSQRVGVGTTSPGGTLDIKAAASTTPLIVQGPSSEFARIDSSGRLLVGTSSAATGFGNLQSHTTGAFAGFYGNFANDVNPAILTLGKSRGNNYTTIVQSGDGVGSLRFNATDGTGNLIRAAQINCEVDGTPGTNDMPGRLVFSTTSDGASSPTERMRITSDGSTLIGTTAPVSVTTGTEDGFTAYSTGATHLSRSGAVSLWLRRRTSDGAIAAFYRDTTQVGTISVTTTATAYNTSSDYRLKENIVPVTDGITRLQQLKPSRFNFIADPTKTVDGFLAHEVQAIVPEAITGEKDAVDEDGKPLYQGIDQSKLVPLLTAALQELVAEVESLKAEVAALKAQ